MKDTITQYYIEFYTADHYDEMHTANFVIQSKWFDTKDEALSWFHNSFDYIDSEEIEVDLMAAEWDDNEGCHNDIYRVVKLV